MAATRGVSGPVKSFLQFCRVEKGLAANSLGSYLLDLQRFSSYLPGPEQNATPEALAGYIESLYRAGLSSRSIARHITTLRNFYKFLVREGVLGQDPAEYLASPRQWTTLPKYLNRE